MRDPHLPVVVAREPVSDKLTLVRFITPDFGTSEVGMSPAIVGTPTEIEVLKVMMAEARATRDAVSVAFQ